MTDEPTTTADILAAWQLIETYELQVTSMLGGGRACESLTCRRGVGVDTVAAIRSWAIAAGVPWPAVKVMPMYAVVGPEKIVAAVDHESTFAILGMMGGKVIPCDVVIRETEGV